MILDTELLRRIDSVAVSDSVILANLIAAARSVVIADCGHMLLAEAPDAVLDALLDFFA